MQSSEEIEKKNRIILSDALPESYSWINRLKRYEGNPILRPHGRGYCADALFNPGATVKDGKVHMICRCINMSRVPKNEKNWSISTFGKAESSDGFNFTMSPEPVAEFDPGEDSRFEGGFEDPRLQKIDDFWMLTYTGVYREPEGKFHVMTPGMAAFSRDLEHWEPAGEILPYRAIAVTDRKIDGKYWAYFGNTGIFPAWSEDLRNWHYSETPVLAPRKGLFDSDLCEAAAAPLINDDGILLIYNGNREPGTAEYYASLVSPSYMPGHPRVFYSVGWALFDRHDPTKLIARSTEPFLSPEKLYEFFGISDFTCFAQGLVQFDHKWILYYGGADMRIAAAYAEIQP